MSQKVDALHQTAIIVISQKYQFSNVKDSCGNLETTHGILQDMQTRSKNRKKNHLKRNHRSMALTITVRDLLTAATVDMKAAIIITTTLTMILATKALIQTVALIAPAKYL